MRVDICYVVSHGFALRMLVQTNLIGLLLERGLKVAIVSLNPEDQNFDVFRENPGISLIQWKESTGIWDDNYLFKRAYFLEDIDANTALKEKFYNSLFFSKSKHPWKRIRPLWYYTIYRLIRVFPGIRQRFLNSESKHLESAEADAIISRLNPRLLVSTYPVSIIEAKMLWAAKKHKVRTVLQMLSWDNITTKGRFPVLADHFLAWGPVMQRELMEYYNLDENEITVTGVPHFDLHVQVREGEVNPEALPSPRPFQGKAYLFFAMSSPRFAPREIDIVEWLAKAVQEGKFGEEVHLVVRPHPQNVQTFMAKTSWLKRLEALEGEKVIVDYPSLNDSQIRWSMQKKDMLALSQLLSGCSLCLNSGSTVSLDALQHHKPVILTSFDGKARLNYWNSARRLVDYTHLKQLCDMGGARITRSYASLEEAIRFFLSDPNHALEQRKSVLYNQCYQDDGKATARAVEVLVKQWEATA